MMDLTDVFIILLLLLLYNRCRYFPKKCPLQRLVRVIVYNKPKNLQTHKYILYKNIFNFSYILKHTLIIF